MKNKHLINFEGKFAVFFKIAVVFVFFRHFFFVQSFEFFILNVTFL